MAREDTIFVQAVWFGVGVLWCVDDGGKGKWTVEDRNKWPKNSKHSGIVQGNKWPKISKLGGIVLKVCRIFRSRQIKKRTNQNNK